MIDPKAFLDAVAGYAADDGQLPIRLGVVDPAYSSGAPKVTLEGTTTLSVSGFAFVAGYVPMASDRVVLLPAGTTYLILGKVVTAPALVPGLATIGRASADVTKNNSTTLGDVTGCGVALAANAGYLVEAWLAYDSNNTADIRFSWTVPSGATGTWAGFGVPTADTDRIGEQDTGVVLFGTLLAFTGDGGGVPASAKPAGFITTASTAGTLQLQFAQNVANVSNTIVKAGSWVRVTRVF